MPAVQLDHIHARLQQAGAAPIHRQRLLRLWLSGAALVGAPSLDNFLPKRVREALPALEAELDALVTLHSVHPSEDGSERLLLGLGDGQRIESVLLPRDGLCVSTQVGCAVGCVFCMTGKSGLLRQVGAHKKLVFSTVGDPRAFERLPQSPVKPALALSLHSTDAALRQQLLPRAPRLTPEELVAWGDDYARRTGYPIQVQWTLLAGINDSPAERDGLVRLLKGLYAVLNLIPYNTVDSLPYQRPHWDDAVAMAKELHQRGVLTKLRQSAGQDIDGGCGQLRARVVGYASRLSDVSGRS